MIGIVDYGMGNLHSILKALQRVDESAYIAHSADELSQATHIILPGVGHFKNGMDRLINLGFLKALNHKVLQEHIPFLGICLGAQLLMDHSEEGNVAGLGWISGNTLKFNLGAESYLKIPHMGWNTIESIQNDEILLDLLSDDQYYFVHSYFIECRSRDHVIATTRYLRVFDTVIRKGNIVGMQFHPEKSHGPGLKLLKNFASVVR